MIEKADQQMTNPQFAGMHLSCCIWAMEGHSENPVAALIEAGYRYMDIRATDFRDIDARPALSVSSVGLSFGIPDGHSLDDSDMERSIETGRHVRNALEHAVWCQVTSAYVVPGFDTSSNAVARFAGQLVHLAEQASEHDIKICVEHFPGRGLPTVAATLSLLRDIGHPNLYLLLDTGHTQISGEDPAQAVNDAGDRLGYVHFDDNDGKEDLHLGLCDGILTEDTIKRTIDALILNNYTGAVSVELSNKLANPLQDLRQSREILIRNSSGSLT